MGNPIILNALQLRLLTEAAASARGPLGDPYFVIETDEPGGPTIHLRHGKPGEPVPARTVLELDTFDQQPDRPVVSEVVMTVDRPPTAVDLSQYDAVFWSEAAVEKFVLPYYASKSMWNAAYVLTQLSELWYGFIPGPDRPHDAVGAAPPEEIPFALAHLPSSDYVGVMDDPTLLGNDLHVLFRREGQVHARPLAELLRERAEAARGTAGHAPRTPGATDDA